jgi:hypothetical protein
VNEAGFDLSLTGQVAPPLTAALEVIAIKRSRFGRSSRPLGYRLLASRDGYLHRN